MQEQLGAASSLLGTYPVPKLQLRDLQALSQASRQLRSIVADAPEAAWRQAALLSTTVHHPLLHSGNVHAILRQQAQLQAAVASPSGWPSSQPVSLDLGAELSPDLQLTAQLEQSGQLVLRQLGSATTQHAFTLPTRAALADAQLLGRTSWSHTGAHVCCAVVSKAKPAEGAQARSLSVHICSRADSSISSWNSELPPSGMGLQAAQWSADDARLALVLDLQRPDLPLTAQLLILDATGEQECLC